MAVLFVGYSNLDNFVPNLMDITSMLVLHICMTLTTIILLPLGFCGSNNDETNQICEDCDNYDLVAQHDTPVYNNVSALLTICFIFRLIVYG